MKIALISPTAVPTDGWGNFTHHYAATLAAKEVEFRLFLPRGHSRLEVPWRERISYHLPQAHLRYGQWRFLSTYLASIAEFGEFDLVHSLFATPAAYIAYKAARAHGIPMVMGAQGTYGIMPFLHRFDRRFHGRVLDSVDRLVVPSHFVKSVLLNFHRGRDLGDRIRILPNGIDTANYHRNNNRDDADPVGEYSRSEIEFVGVGGLKARKGFDVVIRALAIVRRKHPQTVYHIVGGGSEKYQRFLAETAREAGVGDHVHFTGVIHEREIAEKLRRAFAYIHTPVARNWRLEGFGMVYVEANACGIPAIGSHSGGVPDAVRDGYSGLLAEESDPQSTAQCMIRLIEDRALYRELCKNALDWGRSHGWPLVAERFLELYRQVLGTTGRGSGTR